MQTLNGYAFISNDKYEVVMADESHPDGPYVVVWKKSDESKNSPIIAVNLKNDSVQLMGVNEKMSGVEFVSLEDFRSFVKGISSIVSDKGS